jgi:hypothetical protein
MKKYFVKKQLWCPNIINYLVLGPGKNWAFFAVFMLSRTAAFCPENLWDQ